MAGFPIANVLSRRPIAASSEAVVATLRERFEGSAVDLLSPRVEGKRGFILRIDGIHVVPVLRGL